MIIAAGSFDEGLHDLQKKARYKWLPAAVLGAGCYSPSYFCGPRLELEEGLRCCYGVLSTYITIELWALLA